jgi:hypothetical protein
MLLWKIRQQVENPSVREYPSVVNPSASGKSVSGKSVKVVCDLQQFTLHK